MSNFSNDLQERLAEILVRVQLDQDDETVIMSTINELSADVDEDCAFERPLDASKRKLSKLIIREIYDHFKVNEQFRRDKNILMTQFQQDIEKNIKKITFPKDIATSSSTKRRSNFTSSTRQILVQWLKKNRENPYPTQEEKLELMKKTSLSLKQCSNWFINARRRMLKDI